MLSAAAWKPPPAGSSPNLPRSGRHRHRPPDGSPARQQPLAPGRPHFPGSPGEFYETGKVDFATLLDAQRQIRQAKQNRIKAQVDSRIRLAEMNDCWEMTMKRALPTIGIVAAAAWWRILAPATAAVWRRRRGCPAAAPEKRTRRRAASSWTATPMGLADTSPVPERRHGHGLFRFTGKTATSQRPRTRSRSRRRKFRSWGYAPSRRVAAASPRHRRIAGRIEPDERRRTYAIARSSKVTSSACVNATRSAGEQGTAALRVWPGAGVGQREYAIAAQGVAAPEAGAGAKPGGYALAESA